MRVTVSFQLKKSKSRADGICPVYGRCTMNGQRFEISTGFFLSSEMWNESKQLVKGRTEDVRIMNNRLDKIRTRIQDNYNQLESIGEPFDVLSIKERFLGGRKEKGLLEVFDSVVNSIEARLDKDYLKELADICGIQKNLSMHVARHTFATSVTLTNGVPLETVSRMLGHTSLNTT